MARKVIGPAGSKRRRWLFLLCLVVAAGAAASFIPGALAVHDTGSFELDGNAVATTTHDWDQVCFQVTSDSRCGTTTSAGATSASWTADTLQGSTDPFANSQNATIFTGGGSKDPIDVSSWAWKDGAGGLPDKDNLQHAFAARYSLTPTDVPPDPNGPNCPNGTSPFDSSVKCDVLFFGSDRFDNSGDAQQGFWFFQNAISLGSNKVGGGTGFNGVHKPGDILVISDFSNGGTTSTITVYEWDPTVSGNLKQLATSDAANCATAQPGDQFCGIVNPGPGLTTAPWPFTDKSGNHDYLNGEFYEAGINLSTLGLAGECFSSVVSETRSSTSTTATLKDFVLGQFPNCKPNLTTQASATVASPVVPGSPVHDTATITVTGGTNPPDATGDVEFFLCGPIASGDCSTGGTDIGSGTLDGGANTTDGISSATSPDVNTSGSPLASGRYCFRAEWPGDNTYPGALSFTNSTDECFAVKDTSSTSTAQNWLPNDTATVTTGSGAAASGSVTFTLYDNGTCDGNVLATFANRPVSSGTATTNNTTTYVLTTPGATVSWRATFTPSDTNAVNGSTSHCERSVVTINNDIGS
jgi:hypothetical protein